MNVIHSEYLPRSRLGSDAQKLFPFDALEEQIRKIGYYAIFVAALLLPIMCADVESMPDFHKLKEHDFKENTEEVMFRIPEENKSAYNKRVTGMFDDMARLGFF